MGVRLTDYQKRLGEEKKTWQVMAACADATDLFFEESPEAVTAAKEVCYACPVRAKCLEYAIVMRPSAGVWGGLDEQQRDRVHRKITSRRHEPGVVAQTVQEILYKQSA